MFLYAMKRLTLLMCFVLCTVFGLRAQNVTLPYVQDFAALTSGDMLSATGSSTAASASALQGIASVSRAYQAGGVVRLGDGGNDGGFTTQPVVAGTARFLKVSFDAVTWIAATPSPARLVVTYGTQSDTVDLPATAHGWPLSAADMVRYNAVFNALPSPTAITVSAVVGSGIESRVFVDNLKVQATNGVPLSEGFESETFPPEGWTKKRVKGSNEWTRITFNTPIGTACAKVNYGNNSGTENWLITPRMFPAVGDSLTFCMKTERKYTSNPTVVHVKVSTADAAISNFATTAFTLRGNDFSTTWTRYKVDLSPYAGSMVYVAFQVLDTNGLNVLLDDIHGAMILPSTDCSAPKDIALSGITATSANLSWTETGFASSWAVEYSTSSDFAGAVVQTVTGTPSLSLSGLTDNTVYYVRIKADCLGGEYSEWSTTSFITKCLPLSGVINFNEDFEATAIEAIPGCWKKITTNTKYPSVIDDMPLVGLPTKSMKFGGSSPQYLILPRFGVPLNTLQLDFSLNKEQFRSGAFQVGYMTDPTDESTFVPVVTFNDNKYKQLIPYRVFFGNVVDNGNNRYIAFRYGEVGEESFLHTYYYYLDDVAVRTAPACMPPNRPTVVSLYPDSAVLACALPIGADGIQYAYGDTTVTDPSTLTPYTATNDTFAVTGLSPLTQYRVWIRSKCGGTYSDWLPNPLSFTTPYGYIYSLEENFDTIHTDSLPDYWSRISASGARPGVVEPEARYGVPTKAMKFGASSPQYLILPRFGVPLNTLQLDFALDRQNATSGTFQVGYMTDKTDKNTFVAVASFNDVGSSSYQKMFNKRVYFTDVTDNGNNRYIAFRYGKVGEESFNNYSYYWLDEVRVQTAPTCIPPTPMSVAFISSDSVVVTYKSNATAIRYVYGLANVTAPSTLPVNTVDGDTIRLSGLTHNTAYKVWLQSECGSGNISEWSFEPLTFTTLCGSISTLSEDFDNIGDNYMPDCWTRIPANKTLPAVVSPEYGLTSKAMKFGESKALYLVLPRFSVPLNTLQLDFTLDREGENSGTFQVGYMTNPTDSNTFVPVASFDDRNAAIYKKMLRKQVFFSRVADDGTNRYIAFRYGKVGQESFSSAYFYWIDSLSIQPAPACIPPTEPKNISVGADSAVISYLPSIATAQVQYVYKEVSDTRDLSTLTPHNAVGGVAKLLGLSQHTTYNIWLRSRCDSTSYSQWIITPHTFTTKCGDEASISEDFEVVAKDSIPACWSKISNNKFPAVTDGLPQYGVPSKAIMFGSSVPQYLVLNKMDAALNTLQLNFDLNKEHYECGLLQVGYMTDPTDSNTFVSVASFDNGNNIRTMLPKTVYFNSVTDNGNNRYIAFRYGKVGAVEQNTSYSYWIDNISVVPTPACRVPTSLNVSVVSGATTDTAVVRFAHEPSATSWQYVLAKGVDVSTVPPDSISPITFATDNLKISSLEKDKDYTIWIRTVSCTPDTSSWAVALFSTKYCRPRPSSVSEKGITRVRYGVSRIVENSTGKEDGNYGDYSAMSGDVSRGDSARVAITFSTRKDNQNNARIFVDWNRDYDFDDPGETVYEGISEANSPTTLEASFLVPITTANGDYRMRIVGVTNGTRKPVPCYMGYLAAVEDYTLSVVDPLSCRYVKNIAVNNITKSSADITWTAGGSETSWEVVVSKAPLTVAQLDTATSVTVSAASYSASSLAPKTHYYTYIRAVCSASDKSPWQSVEFSTKAPSVSLPYDQDFSGATPEISVWSAEEDANKWSVGNVMGNGGKSMYISKDNGVSAAYDDRKKSHSMAYVTVDFDNSPKFAISFDWIGRGSDFEDDYNGGYWEQDYMMVYMVPDSTELPKTWSQEQYNWFKNVPGARTIGRKYLNRSRWTTVSDTLPSSYAGTKRKLIFMWLNDEGTYSAPTMAIDNISIVGYGCNTPSKVVLDTISTDLARIHWSKGGSETSWIIEYKKADAATWTSVTVSDTVYSFSGLDANTDYRVRIKAVCTGGNRYSAWLSYAFRTRCAAQAIGNTQIIYDFNSYLGKLPECWTRTLARQSSVITYPVVGKFEVYSRDTLLMFGGISTQIVATGEYIEDVRGVELEFDLIKESSLASGTMELGVLSNPYDSSTFVAVHDLSSMLTVGVKTPQRFLLSLSTAPTGKHYIAFRQTITNSAHKGRYGIDNLNIHLVPTCLKPDGIIFNNPHDSSASTMEVNWTPGGSESEWVLQYKRTDSVKWTSVKVSGQPIYTIRNLSPQTRYEVRIRAVCQPNDSSFWTPIRRFDTQCAADTLPFVENFSGCSFSNFPPNSCWGRYTQSASQVFGGAALSNLGTNWTYSENGHGINNGGKAKVNIYGTTLFSWLVTPPILLQSGSKLEFDIALTENGNGTPASGTRVDDKFMVIVSADGGDTWKQENATVWSNDSTGTYVFNDITNTVNHYSIDLSKYSGVVKIAFYAESSVTGNGNNDLHLDNIKVYKPHVTPPTVVTLDADNIGDNTATLHRRITEGTYPIDADGFYYKAASGSQWTPTTDSVVTGLIRGTKYQFYAYAQTNVDGNVQEYQGATLEFTTTGSASVHPTVETRPATDITPNSAMLHKAIVADPSEPVNLQGWKWRKVGASVWTTTYDSLITGLEHSTEYEFYAYATTALKTDGYNGDILHFTTAAHTPPIVVTGNATAIGCYAAMLTKTITAGTEPIVEEGWEYKRVGEVVWTRTTDGNLNNLGQNTEYEFYAYAVTSNYPKVKGAVIRFKTLQCTDLETATYDIDIYPNPADNMVTVAVEGLASAAEVVVIDASGRVVGRYRIAAGESSISIDVSSFAEGNYLVRIISDAIDKVERLVIKKR